MPRVSHSLPFCSCLLVCTRMLADSSSWLRAASASLSTRVYLRAPLDLVSPAPPSSTTAGGLPLCRLELLPRRRHRNLADFLGGCVHRRPGLPFQPRQAVAPHPAQHRVPLLHLLFVRHPVQPDYDRPVAAAFQQSSIVSRRKRQGPGAVPAGFEIATKKGREGGPGVGRRNWPARAPLLSPNCQALFM